MMTMMTSAACMRSSSIMRYVAQRAIRSSNRATYPSSVVAAMALLVRGDDLLHGSKHFFATTTTTGKTTSSSSHNNNSTLPRTNIALLGAVNAGKSVLMNLLTQSDVSLVHETKGTTADPKLCLMELHGAIGPVRLFDTPGINERGELGQHKRERSFQTIGQCDVAMIVVDPFDEASPTCATDLINEVYRRQDMNQRSSVSKGGVDDDTPADTNQRAGAASLTQTPNRVPTAPTPLLVFNLRHDKVKELERAGGSISLVLDEVEKNISQKVDPLPPTLAVDFSAVRSSTAVGTAGAASRDRVISFLERYAKPRADSVTLLPDGLIDTHTNGRSPTVFLNIPMDQQTPGFRLLRPQAMIQEALIRHFVSTYAYRMDLGLARSANPVDRQKEKDRFMRSIDPLLVSGDLSLLITDSQAIDIVAPWTLDESGHEIVPITTFSIAMVRYLSGGRLPYFADGLRKLDQMVNGEVSPTSGDKWKVLITEACNHTRLNIEKQCADIGTVQIPDHLSSILGSENVEFDYAFGKHVLFDPKGVDLAVHCGGCMLTPQQMSQRVADLMASGVAATNYGLLLSKIQSPQTLSRVLRPWGIEYGNEIEDTDHYESLG